MEQSNKKKPKTFDDKLKSYTGNIIDITKTGPLNYRQLQEINPGLTEPSKEYLEDDSQIAIASTLAKPTFRKVEVPQNYDVGESIWDQGIYSPSELEQYQDIRAEKQPWYSKATSGILKGVGLAGTTFLDGTLGLADGIVESIMEGDLTKLWDNHTTQFLDQLNKDMEKALPNYYTREERENPWGNILSANFIFDKFVKNLGFTVGAAYSGGVYTKALNVAMKGVGALTGATKALTGVKMAEGIGTLERMQKYAEIGSRAFNMKKSVRAARAAVGSTFSAIAEGTVEAVSNSNDQANLAYMELEDKVSKDKVAASEEFKNNIYSGMSEEEATFIYNDKIAQIDAVAQQTKDKIEENRKKMGSGILMANIPILALNNYFMFGKMFMGGFKAGRNQINTYTRATKEAQRAAKDAWKLGNKEVQQNLDRVLIKAKNKGYNTLTDAEKALVEEAPYHILGPKMGAIWGAIKSPLRESNEEMMQALASEVAGDYYKKESDYIYDSQIHPESTQELAQGMDRFWDSFKSGVSNTYGNLNRWEDGFIGALIGAMGSPTFGRQNNATDQTWLGRGKPIGLFGGAITEYRDYMRGRREEQKVADEVTRILKDPKTLDRIKHTVAQIKMSKDKDTALRLNDKKLFKDVETAALFEDIMYLKRANKLDEFKAMLSSIDGATDEEIQEIADSTSKLISARDNQVNERRNAYFNANDKLNKAINQTVEISNQIQEATDNNDSQDVITLLQQRYDEALVNQKQLEEQTSTLSQYLTDDDIKEQSPYIHEDGTAFTTDEIRQDLNKRSEKAKALIDEISKVQDQLDLATSEALTDEQLATMTYLEIAKRDWSKRGAEIVNTLKSELQDSNIFNTLVSNLQQNLDSLEKLTEGKLPKEIREKTENAINNLTILKDNIGKLLAQPELLIPYLAYNMETEVTDKDGKKVKSDAKDSILKALKTAVDSNPLYGEQDKKLRNQDIDDLEKIVDSYREYDNKLKEYMTQPSKIEEAHKKSNNKAKNKAVKSTFSTIKKEINFKDPKSIKAAYNKYNQAVKDAGGWNAFLASLSEDERKAVIDATDEDAIDKTIKGAINEDDNIDDKLKGALNKLVSEEVPNLTQQALNDLSQDSSSLDKAISKVAQESVEDEGIEDLAAKASAISEREQKLKEALDRALKHAAEAVDEAKGAEDAKLQAALKATSEGKIDEDSVTLSQEAINATQEGPNLTPEQISQASQDGEPYIESNNRSENYVKKERKTHGLTPQGRKKGYERKRQFTEYYIFGEDGQTLYDYYLNNKNRIPQGVDQDKFLEYIKVVSEFLRTSGAFTYISGINPDFRLNKGDKIFFSVEPSISTQDNPVVVMRVESGQVVGTIRSKYDFDIYDAEVQADKSKANKSIEAQRELYNKIVELHKSGSQERISTTVESLEKGSLPLASQDSSLAKIFEDKVPIIGLVTGDQSNLKIDTGGRDISIAMPSNFTLARGQIYVLIPTNTGTYIPAMCYSLPIYQLADDDWYISQTIDTFMNMIQSTSDILRLKQEFVKWFPIKDFHIDLQKVVDGKYVPVDTKETATHLSVKFTDIDGKSQKFTYKLVDKNGQKLSDEDLKRKFIEFIKKTAKANNLQTNLDKRRLNDQEYIKKIANYFMSNLMVGIRGQHSMNDGFLYSPTQIEQQYEEKDKTGPTTTKTTQDKDNVTTSVSFNGEQYTIDMANVIRNSKGEVVEDSLKEQIIKSITTLKVEEKSEEGEPPKKPQNKLSTSSRGTSAAERAQKRAQRRVPINMGPTIGVKKATTEQQNEIDSEEEKRRKEEERKTIEKERNEILQELVSISKAIDNAERAFSSEEYETLSNHIESLLTVYKDFSTEPKDSINETIFKIRDRLKVSRSFPFLLRSTVGDIKNWNTLEDVEKNKNTLRVIKEYIEDFKSITRQLEDSISDIESKAAYGLKYSTLSTGKDGEAFKKKLQSEKITKEEYEKLSPIDQYKLVKCIK